MLKIKDFIRQANDVKQKSLNVETHRLANFLSINVEIELTIKTISESLIEFSKCLGFRTDYLLN